VVTENIELKTKNQLLHDQIKDQNMLNVQIENLIIENKNLNLQISNLEKHAIEQDFVINNLKKDNVELKEANLNLNNRMDKLENQQSYG
jgi:hypothetical protein